MTEALRQTNFTNFDWLIVVAYVSVSLFVGLAVKRFSTDMTSYIAAGRNVGAWLGIATMTGTELGLITVMYSAEKGFKGGFAAFHIAVLAGLVTLGVGITGFIVVPLRAQGGSRSPSTMNVDSTARLECWGGSCWPSAAF